MPIMHFHLRSFLLGVGASIFSQSYSLALAFITNPRRGPYFPAILSKGGSPMTLARVPIHLILLIFLVLVMSFSNTAFARKALRPVMGPDNTVISWQEVEISEEQVPMGVDAIPDAKEVFGYPHESIGLHINPRTAGIDTTTPPTQVYTSVPKVMSCPNPARGMHGVMLRFIPVFWAWKQNPY